MIAEHIGARTDQGPYRDTNQDAYWVSDANDPIQWGELYIVTDGVGGQEYGAVAAQMAAEVIHTDFYRRRQAGESIPEALGQAIHQANQAIFEESQTRGGVKMGCTVVAAVQHENLLHLAHVGDARIYLLHKNKLQQLTIDDSWVQRQLDAGIITPEEAENHEMRNVVTQALGNRLDITVHQSPRADFRSGDRLLLCTDGLHGVLANAEMIKLLKNNAPQEAADALVEAAIAAQTQDNVTAVVVRLNKTAKAAAAMTIIEKRRPLPDSKPPGRKLPPWVIITLITLLLLLLAGGAYALWSASATPEKETAAPTKSVPAVVPATNTPPPTAVPPTETATIPPTETAIPLPTETAPPPPIPDSPFIMPPTAVPLPPSLPVGRITSNVYVWTDEQIRANDCQQIAATLLPTGTIVNILEPETVTVNGPDNVCSSNEFIKVQSVTNRRITGWVLEYAVNR
jgi:protein phosphatase